jgi:enoyl-CoA hydratase
MTFSTLLLEDVQQVRIITINRPDKLNAINQVVLSELDQAFTDCLRDDHICGVMIIGAGEKAFVAGADISEFVGLSPAHGEQIAQRGQRLFNTIENSPKPVIAAVNGYAFGGGCELTLACHLRIASTNARFAQPEVKLGLITGFGGSQRLSRLIGRGRALEMLLTGKTVDAAMALSWGLVNQVVEPAELRAAVLDLATTILAVAPLAVARTIAAVNQGADLPIERGQALEAGLFGLCFATADMAEGTKAFIEKRAPHFTGQ